MCAWTTKSERFGAGLAQNTATDNNLGPGSYISHGKYDEQQNFAPFTSTQERGAAIGSKAPSRAPPPGTYDPMLPGAYESGLPKKFVAFKSSATRFGAGFEQKEKKPGPGAYRIGSNYSDTMSHRTMGLPTSEKKPVLRSFSAPSIPQSHQSYGYEEAPGGRLQRQGPVDGVVGHSGRVGDCVGPGEYGQYEDIKRRPAGGKFGNSSRNGLWQHETPGPGHYTEKRLNRPPKLGSSFASKVQRVDELTAHRIREEHPGPGQYNGFVESKPSLRETHAEMQFFGSTVERFKKGSTTNTDRTPGPGSYQPRVKREKTFATPFNQVADRYDNRPTHNFQKQGGFQQTGPGPGAYNSGTCFGNGVDADSAECTKTFSVLGNSGGLAFGAMTKRFVRADVKADTVPGPGQYERDDDQEKGDSRPRSASRRNRARIPGYQFKSKTPKDIELQHEAKVASGKPPPGAYDPKPIQEAGAIVRVPGKKEGFLSAAGRFGGTKPDLKVPGPGMYNPGAQRSKSFNRSLSQGVPVRGRSTNLGFTSQADRFPDQPITEQHHKTPGPGTYETQPEWVSRTYNCMFGEVL